MVMFKLRDAKSRAPYLAWAGFPARWTSEPIKALKVTKDRADRLEKDWPWLKAHAERISAEREG